MTGSKFYEKIIGKSGVERDKLIVEAVIDGFMPKFMVPVQVGPIRVMPDYVCVGTDEDYFYCPMLISGAEEVLAHYGASLPTAREVDLIYSSAQIKLDPKPLPYGPQMGSSEWFKRHNDIVAGQLGGAPKGIVAGHKKDLVSPYKAGRITIYGWHQRNGKPIQPESGVHDAAWVDYSHGVRMIWR